MGGKIQRKATSPYKPHGSEPRKKVALYSLETTVILFFIILTEKMPVFFSAIKCNGCFSFWSPPYLVARSRSTLTSHVCSFSALGCFKQGTLHREKRKKSRLQPSQKKKMMNLLQKLHFFFRTDPLTPEHDQYFKLCGRRVAGMPAAPLMPVCGCLRASVTTAGRLRRRQ